MISDAIIRPSVARRALVASSIGIAAGALAVLRFERITWHPSDFGMIWFGARALLHGANPYGLVGPGMQYDFPWTVNYPATSFVVALPLTPFSEVVATFLFVAISAALLAYGISEKGWGRLPIFLSWPFILAALVGQWSPIVSAAFLLPAVGWIVVAKPNLGLAVLASTSSSRLLKIAAIGGVALTAVAFALFPSWPRAWLSVVASQHHFFAPVTRIGGFAILLALLRWRRPEARLIVALACVPQTNSWYEAVPVMLVASTYREALALSLISLLGYVIPPYVMTARNEVEFNSQMGSLMVAICYLPATIMVLRRKNEGELPPWVLMLRRLLKKNNIESHL
ncbi:MAG TPA: hypothetical protein VIF83_09140 [Gemmatimonadaceae bacterium]